MDKNDPQVQAALKTLENTLGQHGGRVELVDINPQGVALVRLEGACRGCAGATATLRNVVERVLKEKVPQITGVESVL